MKCSNHFPMQIYNYIFSFLEKFIHKVIIVKNMGHLQKLVEE